MVYSASRMPTMYARMGCRLSARYAKTRVSKLRKLNFPYNKRNKKCQRINPAKA